MARDLGSDFHASFDTFNAHNYSIYRGLLAINVLLCA